MMTIDDDFAVLRQSNALDLCIDSIEMHVEEQGKRIAELEAVLRPAATGLAEILAAASNAKNSGYGHGQMREAVEHIYKLAAKALHAEELSAGHAKADAQVKERWPDHGEHDVELKDDDVGHEL